MVERWSMSFSFSGCPSTAKTEFFFCRCEEGVVCQFQCNLMRQSKKRKVHHFVILRFHFRFPCKVSDFKILIHGGLPIYISFIVLSLVIFGNDILCHIKRKSIEKYCICPFMKFKSKYVLIKYLCIPSDLQTLRSQTISAPRHFGPNHLGPSHFDLIHLGPTDTSAPIHLGP